MLDVNFDSSISLYPALKFFAISFIKVPEMKVVHSKSKDLMAQLKASLESGNKRKKAS